MLPGSVSGVRAVARAALPSSASLPSYTFYSLSFVFLSCFQCGRSAGGMCGRGRKSVCAHNTARSPAGFSNTVELGGFTSALEGPCPGVAGSSASMPHSALGLFAANFSRGNLWAGNSKIFCCCCFPVGPTTHSRPLLSGGQLKGPQQSFTASHRKAKILGAWHYFSALIICMIKGSLQ